MKNHFSTAVNRRDERGGDDAAPESTGKGVAWFPFLRSLSDEAAELFLARAITTPVILSPDGFDTESARLKHTIGAGLISSLADLDANGEMRRHRAIVELLRAFDADPAPCHDCLRAIVIHRWYGDMAQRIGRAER